MPFSESALFPPDALPAARTKIVAPSRPLSSTNRSKQGCSKADSNDGRSSIRRRFPSAASFRWSQSSALRVTLTGFPVREAYDLRDGFVRLRGVEHPHACFGALCREAPQQIEGGIAMLVVISGNRRDERRNLAEHIVVRIEFLASGERPFSQSGVPRGDFEIKREVGERERLTRKIHPEILPAGEPLGALVRRSPRERLPSPPRSAEPEAPRSPTPLASATHAASARFCRSVGDCCPKVSRTARTKERFFIAWSKQTAKTRKSPNRSGATRIASLRPTSNSACSRLRKTCSILIGPVPSTGTAGGKKIRRARHGCQHRYEAAEYVRRESVRTPEASEGSPPRNA